MADELDGLLAQAGIQYGTQEELAEKAENKEPQKHETQEAPETPEKKEPEKKPESTDRLKLFGEAFGKEFKEETEFEAYKSSLTEKASKHDELFTEAEKLRARVSELEAGIDPSKFFANKNEQIRQQLLIKYPEYDPAVLSKVVASDFSKTYKEDPVEVLKLKLMFEDPDIYDTEEAALKGVYSLYGIDPENTDENDRIVIEDVKFKTLQKEAKAANKKFAEIRDGVKLPDAVKVSEELEAKNKEIKEKQDRTRELWKPVLRNIPDEIKSVDFTEKDGDKDVEKVFFSFDVDDKFREKLKDTLKPVLDAIAKDGVELTKDNEKKLVSTIIAQAKRDYIAENFNAIGVALKKAILKEEADRQHKDVHNPRGLSSQEAPVRTPEEQKAADKFYSNILQDLPKG